MCIRDSNYTGTLTTEFVILPKNINDKTDSVYNVGLTEILEVEYTGELLTPVLPLKYNGHDLVEGCLLYTSRCV